MMRYEFQPDGGNTVPRVQTPYRLVTYTAGWEDRWVALLEASSEFAQFSEWTTERLTREILSDLVPDGGVLALCNDEPVACAAACRVPKFLPDSTLMYVVTLPEHRGRGLGRAVTAAAMHASCRAGHPGMVLQTDDCRVAAIAAYLKLGFKPVLVDKFAAVRWDTVLEELHAPRPQMVKLEELTGLCGVPPDSSTHIARPAA
jgi:mycothiol synthase